jgi:hypothetical protein
MANWLKKWLDKLAEENNKAFNGKKLDCCELNSNSNKSTASHTSSNKK